jgi:hypothetical protein
MAQFYLLGAAKRLLRGRGVQTFAAHRVPVALRPIDASCIEEGAPVARVVTLTESPDKRLSSGVWECSAGKFRVTYGLDEVVLVLDGGVTVREDGTGVCHTLGPGDAAYFPMGLVTHWDVRQFVRKFFVVRVPGGNPQVARLRQRLAI